MIALIEKKFDSPKQSSDLARRAIQQSILKNTGMCVSKNNISIVRKRLQKPTWQSRTRNMSPRIDFSISHTNEYLAVVAAPTTNGTVGIDIETIRDFSEQFMRAFMTNREFLKAQHYCGEAQKKYATLLWTAKEAHLKAIGTGLLRHPSHVEVYIKKKSIKTCDRALHIFGSGQWLQINPHHIFSIITIKYHGRRTEN